MSDLELELLWDRFGDVPINPYTEGIEESFFGFPEGTYREEIWAWFDMMHSKGVYFLMYGEADDEKE